MTMNNRSATNGDDDDDDFARSEQVAADMQYAYDLQAQQEQLLGYDQISREQQPQPQRQHTDWTNYPGSRSVSQTPVIRGVPVPHSSLPLQSLYSPTPSVPNHSLSAALHDGSSTANYNSNLLYVPCEINGRMVEMMVDTGAQSSVISRPMMNILNLQSKLNTRMTGVASGVGRARISGRIENCPVQLGHVEFHLFFLVLDTPDNIMILGIDQMRRFNCMIDLEHNKLIFGGRDGVEVEFLEQDPAPAVALVQENCSVS